MSKNTTAIQLLEQQLRTRFPHAHIELDEPAAKNGMWFLDVKHDDHLVIIQWNVDHGFGISCSPVHAYGERPDEVYTNEEAAFARTVSLLLSKSYTAPPESVRLRELRKLRGVSQVELAALLSIQQGAVSKLERRQDMLLSTVRQVVRSMGGTLQLIAKFPDGMERALEFEDIEETADDNTELSTS